MPRSTVSAKPCVSTRSMSSCRSSRRRWRWCGRRSPTSPSGWEWLSRRPADPSPGGIPAVPGDRDAASGHLAQARNRSCVLGFVPRMTRIGTSDLDIFPLSLGGNVFGWTADRDASFAILDEFVAGGGDFIDTADSYSAWVPGNTGGDSERIIGEWLTSRRPEGIVVATK